MTRSHENKPNVQHNRLHLFLIRAWREPGNDGEAEWRGVLQRVVSGESQTFQGLDGLAPLLAELLPARNQLSPSTEEPRGEVEE